MFYCTDLEVYLCRPLLALESLYQQSRLNFSLLKKYISQFLDVKQTVALPSS